MAMKTIKISELISALEELKSRAGDLPIVMSRDSEGNSFGTISATESCGYENGIATLWPYHQFEDFEEIEGYVPEDEGNDVCKEL
jgi:hypothetical protein